MNEAAQARDELRFMLGPTASGKSSLALEVAERAGAEIVSLDSMLVYRGMDIGTAKPGAGERARVPHHAIDLVEPSAVFTVQDYLKAAQAALASITARGRRALFVGGTAFYYKALTQGLFEGPPLDAALRAALEARYEREGAAALHAELARIDAVSAARIHANDKKRVVRALEVWEQSGKPLTEWQREWGWGDPSQPKRGRARRVVGLALETAELDARIAARIVAMLDAGWPDEARAIRDAGGFSTTSSQALGYSEALALADGSLTRTEAERRIYLATRQFARRQRTWLRKFNETRWVAAPKREDLAERVDEVLGVLWP